jgi:hypothetical protein
LGLFELQAGIVDNERMKHLMPITTCPFSPSPTSPTQCALCQRERPLTFHHLIPRTLHSNKWFKKNFTRDDMQTRGIMVCKQCHKHIHRTYPHKVLGRQLNTLEALRSAPKIKQFVKWAEKQQ